LKLIVGLGNPGKKYEWSRHNLGFMVIDTLADQYGLTWKKNQVHHGWISRGRLGAQLCQLFKPAMYMNRSGQAVGSLRRYLGLELFDLLVICDDLNLDFGQIRIRPTGSDGGHNGLDSVIRHLGSKDFGRLRIGIGAPSPGQDPADFVLSEFYSGERKELGHLCDEAATCCVAWLSQGMGKTMNRFNQRKKKEKGIRDKEKDKGKRKKENE